jgi:hypothetical protein
MAAANIIPFPMRDANTFAEAWACRAGQMRKRGDGSEKTRKLWNKAAAKVGHARLLDALKRYLREEKEPTCGYPGLSVWLNGERYDHWLPDEAAVAKIERPPYPQRPTLIAALGEPFVVSYIDPATVHPDGWITPATEYAKGKLRERGRDLKAAGIMGLRAKS